MSAAVLNRPAAADLALSNDAATIKSAMSLDAILAPSETDMKASQSLSPSPVPAPVPEFAFIDGTETVTKSAERASSPSEMSTGSGDSPNHSSSDDVDAHNQRPIDREFDCMFDEFSDCRTGQYTLKLSRKVISNHFGRNKACTREIKNWPLFCRKHYQRATYKPELWQRRKVNLILRQFDVIEKEHPGTTYVVSLKKSEEQRLNDFARLLASGTSIDLAATQVAPNGDVKSFQAPIDVLRELEYELGGAKTMDQVKHTLSIINEMLRNGETKEVPSIEFLPEIAPKPSKVTKSKAPFTKSTATRLTKSARISRKGAVQKPRAK